MELYFNKIFYPMKHYFLFFFFLLCFYPVHLTGKNRLDSIVQNMTEQLLLYPQEKIYLHTDKPYYVSGETVFFRAYLLNALNNQPLPLSRYIYVELINPLNEWVQRIKIRPENGLFYGTITLPEDLPQGDYRLRAYTYFMQNLDPDYFYSRNIRVIDPFATDIAMERKVTYGKKNEVYLNLSFKEPETGKTVYPETVSLQLNKGKPATPYPVMPSLSYNEEQIKKYEASDVRTLFHFIPEIFILGDIVALSNSNKGGLFPLLLVDGEEIPTGANPWAGIAGNSEYFLEILNNINIDDIAQIDIAPYDPAMSKILGIISIQRKNNRGKVIIKKDNARIVTPLGYQKPVEFYSPQYDTPEAIESYAPDLRTTIYWNPGAVTDSTGKASIHYYTADNPTTYTLIIEGVSDEGKLIHHEEKAFINVY
jgi:hypothetical protein